MQPINDSLSPKFQVQIDPESFENNIILNRSNEVFRLQDFANLLTKNLKTKELINFQKILTTEVNARKSFLCEKIPNDVWTTIFLLVAHNEDISFSSHIKQVCSHWRKCFNDSLEEAIITKENSFNLISTLGNLRSLTIRSRGKVTLEIFQNNFTGLHTLKLHSTMASCNADVSPEMWSRLTNLKTLELADSGYDYLNGDFMIRTKNIVFLTNLQSLTLGEGEYICESGLKKLIHLKKLILSNSQMVNEHDVTVTLGENFEVLDSLQELEIIELRNLEYFHYHALQEKFPHVRFRWLWMSLDGSVIGCYEGGFDEGNLRHGKGLMMYSDGSIYEGEWDHGEKTREGECCHDL